VALVPLDPGPAGMYMGGNTLGATFCSASNPPPPLPPLPLAISAVSRPFFACFSSLRADSNAMEN